MLFGLRRFHFRIAPARRGAATLAPFVPTRIAAEVQKFRTHHVEEATNGFQALQRLDTVNPDVIVLDLMLPGLDGLTVLDELAANAHTRSIPVVVVTGTINVEVLQLNVPCVLHKPVTSGRLLKAVRECLAGGAPPAGA